MVNPISGMRGFLADAVNSDAVGSAWDAVTSPFARGAAEVIEPLGTPSLPGSGDVPIYNVVRGIVDRPDPFDPIASSATDRAAAIRAGGFPEHSKTFWTIDRNRALEMLPEYWGTGGLQGSPDEFMFEGKLSGDQIAKSARKSPFGYEGLLDPSEANKAFGVGNVPQTTTAKAVPVNRFLGLNLDDLVGKIGLNSRRGLEALQNIPGYKGITDVIADSALADAIGSNKALTAAKILGGAARFMPFVQTPLGAVATVGHARDIAEANERGDTLQALSSTLKTGLAGASSIPIVGIAPYLAELGLEGAEEIRNRFFPFDAGEEAVGAEQSSQPFNFDEVDSGTVESFFDIPPVVNENTLMMNSLMPISTDSGTVIVEDTPEGTILTDNTPVDVMPWGAGEQYMDAQGFDTVMPVLNPFDTDSGIESTYPDFNAPFNYTLDLRPETTAEEFDDFITSQILGVDIPEETTVTPTVVPDLSAIGINPTPDYTWQEVLGMGQPGPGGPVRPAFNVDEFGNRASLARFTEPEVDTDDFIRENLIEAVAPAPTVTRSQPGPGGPVRESQKDREAREAREQGAKDKKKPKPKPKPKPRKKPKPKPKPVATQPTVTRDTDWVRKSLEEHDKLFGKKANPYAWKGIKKIAPGATRGIIY